MALSFASAIGNLFDRLGKLGLLIRQMRTYQDAQFTNMTSSTAGVTGQFVGEPDIQALMGNAYIGLLDGGSDSLGSTVQNIARAAVNRMVFRDNPQFNQNLTRGDSATSLAEIIRQMKVAGASVLAMTISATTSTFTGRGDGVIVASVRRPTDGLVLENSYAETVRVLCSKDSYVGGATEGSENFLITGGGANVSPFAFNWPLGSGASVTITAIDGDLDANVNLLTNSDFATFTSNVPNNWTLVTGTAGTHLARETSIVFGTAGALRIIGDGSNLTEIKQRFGNSAGTTASLDSMTQYAFNVFVRRDGTAAAAGVLTVDLVDQNNTVIADSLGTNNSFTIDLTGLTINYASYSGVFRTPRVLSSQQFLRFRLTTALTDGRSVYLDKASMGIMTQIYSSGPYVSVHSGATPFIQGDYGTVTVTNSRGAAGTLSTWQTLFARMFSSEMIGGQLLLPSSSTSTISDSLIS